VPDTLVLEKLIDITEEAVVSLRGEHYDVADRVSYTFRLTSIEGVEDLDPHVVERGIFSHIDGVDLHYVVSVDGEPVGYVEDAEALQEAMDQRIALLLETGTFSANFLSRVDYDFQLVDLDKVHIVDDIYAFVESLTMETVEVVILAETIPFEVDIVLDDRRLIDSSEVLQVGAHGEKEIVTLVTYIDGEQVGYTILQTKIITEAITEIVLEGTQERPLTASFGYYIWPTNGTVSSFFGPRRVAIGSSNHQGIDISAPAGTPVYAADGGEVIFVAWSGGFGNLIKILHDNGHVTYYAHLRSMDVSVGERVYRGQYIGGVGMTGTASGNHLHFEIRIDGIPVDPMPFLP
ncbi:MAG: peptidoglycan DD-metalloendopeptidase family protein, partial [Oscillospiraceae bacterium]|nr:peptidoglycan DD-metalloendopeptidase family protein [Oscillospiraceae bacterium]